MTSKMPPVPPANRSPKEGGHDRRAPLNERNTSLAITDPDNQGQQANSKQNTTHQGYQQDR